MRDIIDNLPIGAVLDIHTTGGWRLTGRKNSATQSHPGGWTVWIKVPAAHGNKPTVAAINGANIEAVEFDPADWQTAQDPAEWRQRQESAS